jgi:glycosyltransferase involved in cell wall biosynthesis
MIDAIHHAAELPMVTVGLTSYRSGETIASAIASALAQDWPRLEVLIVDDASPDDSAQVIAAAIARDARARLVRRAVNGGPAAARNTLLAEASGEFIAFFDDDDTSRPDRVRIQLQRLLQHQRSNGTNLVACYASGSRRYANGYTLQVDAIGSRGPALVGPAVADYLLFNGRRAGLFYGGGTPTCALMARVATLQALGGFDANLRRVEDVDLAVRLALAGGHFIGCPERLYEQTATRGSDKTPAVNLQAELQLVDKHAGYLRQRRRHAYARDWFRIRFLHFTRQRLRFAAALAFFLLRFPLAGTRHLLRSAPGRLRHEHSIARTP